MTTKTPKDADITITVKAKDLFPMPLSEQNVDNNTYLLDDEGFESRYGVSNKNYQTGVYLNKKITWNIKVADKNGDDKDYDVELVEIIHNPGDNNPDFFNGIIPKPGNNKKKISATIINEPSTSDLMDNYTIYFKIIHGENWNTFPLDPKLKMKDDGSK